MSVRAAPGLRPYTPGQLSGFALIIGVVLSISTIGVLIVLEWMAAAVVAVIAVSFYVATRPRHGLYLLFAAVIVVEGGSVVPFLDEADFIYRSSNNVGGGGFIPFSPLEGGMALVVLGTLLQANRAKALRFGDFFWPLLILAFLVAVGVVRGMTTGGAFSAAFHEVRTFLYMPLVYFAAVNLLQERRHFQQLAVVLVTAVAIMSIGAIWTHYNEVLTGELDSILDFGFAHENAIFGGVLVIFALAVLIWGNGFGPRIALLLPGALALAAVLVMKRRLGLLALDMGLVIVAMVLIRHNWRVALFIAPAVIIVTGLYLGTYWNATGGMGQGARAFRSIIGQEQQTEDISSRTYRELEAFNVEQNIRWRPIDGTGFGKAYAFPAPLPDLTGFWPFQQFIPHNTVLWTWMKGGLLTFIALAGLFGYAMIRAMALARRPLDPLLRAWAVTVAASIPMVLTFGWGDLGLTNERTMIVFATMLGVIAALATMPEVQEEGRAGGRIIAIGGGGRRLDR